MSGRSSRAKGASAEREVAAIFRGFGITARRTPLSGGMQWKGDLILDDRIPLHVEVKRAERLCIPQWWAQTLADCPVQKYPLLVFRSNREDWRVLLTLNDFLAIARDGNYGAGAAGEE